jgi:hypothetical protein
MASKLIVGCARRARQFQRLSTTILVARSDVLLSQVRGTHRAGIDMLPMSSGFELVMRDKRDRLHGTRSMLSRMLVRADNQRVEVPL